MAFEYRLRIYGVPIPTLIAFLEAAASHPHRDPSQIGSFAGFSNSTARRAIPVLESLGLVERGAEGKLVCRADTVRRGMKPDSARLVLRRALNGYRPFEAVCEGLQWGEHPTDAIRKAALLLGIDKSESPKFKVLLRWGIELGILNPEEDGSLKLSAEVATESGKEFGIIEIEDVESEARARLYNAKRLGREANNFLDEVDRQLLVDSLLSYRSDPGESVEKAGQALEDFLRQVAEAKELGPEARKCTGASQLAGLLVSRGVIHSHHQKLVDPIGTVRNAKAHRKDKRTLAPWEITEFAAFWAFAGALTSIRSVFEFVNGGRQTI